MADFVTEDAIVETKFKRNFDLADFVQLYLYGLLIDPLQQKKRVLLNLRTGETLRFRFDPATHKALAAHIFAALPNSHRFCHAPLPDGTDPLLGVDYVDAHFVASVYRAEDAKNQ